MQCTLLETYRQSRVVVVVVVVAVGAYFPVTGNHPIGFTVARRMTTLGRGSLLLRITLTFFAVASMDAAESPPVSGDAPPPLGGDAPPYKDPITAPDKDSARDAAPGKGATGVSKSLLVKSRIWSINSCTYRSADTPRAS